MSEALEILVIDDNQGVRSALRLMLELEGWRVREAIGPEQALAAVKQTPPDLIMQDMNFTADTNSGTEGVQLFHALHAHLPEVPIILMTAWTHLDQAVALVRAGAADYLAKPWDNDRLRTTVRNLMALAAARQESKAQASELYRQKVELKSAKLCGAIIESPQMVDVVRLALRVAASDISVLITGANGAGKERLAELIHANSKLADRPMLTLNCGALPSELLEAELFGAEAGAYTGAVKSREGKFAAADGGTLLLDEIGNLSLNGQAKLLRVLESGEYSKLGSNHIRKAKVRVLSATNADLKSMIQAGSFREDLYYRLNVIELNVPPLSARPKDILPIARSFLAPNQKLSLDAERALLKHDWPGNVRELKNAMSRASLLATGSIIEADDLKLPLPSTKAASADTVTSELKAEEIIEALRLANGVVADAAATLGLSRQALYRRMERFNIGKASE